MNYFAPTIEIVKLDVEDIILASSTTGGGNTGKPGGMGGGNETGWVSVDGGYIGGGCFGNITIGIYRYRNRYKGIN